MAADQNEASRLADEIKRLRKALEEIEGSPRAGIGCEQQEIARKALSREYIGRGICDGCGNEGELTAFNAPGVACGICICDACLASDEKDAGRGR